jgi:hypothetical protein
MNILTKYKKVIANIFFVLFIAAVLLVSVRGLPGNPTPAQLNTATWVNNGPFELSPERGRFALLYSLVENHTFHLAPALAKFTAPDVGFWKGHFVSIFAPSISLLAIPGYIIGKHFGDSQFGAFAWMSIFALLNVLLIRAIAVRFGANPIAASIAGLAFLFGTPAYAYAVTIYEHHPSTFLMLLAFYLLIRFKSVLSLVVIWILYAFAFTVDYPNLIMMFPIALAAFFRSGVVEHVHKKVTVKISLPRVLAVLGVIIPLIMFLWINQMSYGSPFQISGTVARVIGVKNNGAPIFFSQALQQQLTKSGQQDNLPPPDSILTFFNPRNMLNGFYILLLSPDRGVIMYTPVVLFGAVGMYLAYKKRQKYIPVMLGVVGADLILYAMWGDPYGGWAFGARYLIPAYAVLSIYIALLLTYLGKNKLFILFFYVVLSYSVIVNSLGALTSNSNPPKIEADALSNQIHQPVSYTYMRNVNDLNGNVSKSFAFVAYASDYITAWQYYSYITLFILSVSAALIVYYQVTLRDKRRRGGQYAL